MTPTNIDETKAAKISYNKLINAFPTLEKIDEQYKNDILTLAFANILNSKSQYTGGNSDCVGRYRVEVIFACLAGAGCSQMAGGLGFPPLIAAANIVCVGLCCQACYYAYQDYQTCLGN